MNRTKLLKMLESALMMVLAAGVMSCSKDHDYYDESISEYKPDNPSVTLSYSYRGVWAVDGVIADTVNVDVCVNPETETENKNLVAFSGFPYRAIVSKVASEVNVTEITDSMHIGCRCIGISETAIYLELFPGRDVSDLYLPFTLTTDKGEVFSVTATLVPSWSTATVNIRGESFTTILTVSQVEMVLNGEKKIKTLSPEMKMKFTSIQRTK